VTGHEHSDEADAGYRLRAREPLRQEHHHADWIPVGGMMRFQNAGLTDLTRSGRASL
jgi:hypothetical protein